MLSLDEAIKKAGARLPYFNRDDTADDRYVVLFGTTYAHGDEVLSAKDAAFWALDLTQDAGWNGTYWIVIDRETGEVHEIEQGEFAEWSDGGFVRRSA